MSDNCFTYDYTKNCLLGKFPRKNLPTNRVRLMEKMHIGRCAEVLVRNMMLLSKLLKLDFISGLKLNFFLNRFRLSISRHAVPSTCRDCCDKRGGCSSKFYYKLVIELNRFTFE